MKFKPIAPVSRNLLKISLSLKSGSEEIILDYYTDANEINVNMDVQYPLVSIISPTFNHEKFISDCIESVLSQTYQNWEMIIIDDGSTDKTYEIASRYAQKESRIRTFTRSNIGIFRLGESYNFALSKCTGKYIAVLECDDVWLPDKLSIQIKVMEEQPACVLSWGQAWRSSIDLSHNYSLAPGNIEDEPCFSNSPIGSFLKIYIFKTLVPALTIVIRHDALLETGGFIQGFNLPLVDIPTTLELMMKGNFAYINQPLGCWRLYPTQVTKTYTGEMIEGYYALIQSLIERFPEVFKSHELGKAEIDSNFRRRLIISHSSSGRYKLIRKDFKGARKDYLKSILNYGWSEPVWKLRSLVGLFFSFLRTDVEWLAKLIGNESYK